MKIMKRHYFVLALLIGLVSFGASQQLTHAAPVTGFDAGKIMDDGIFTRKNSMTAAQIQSFLNSKMPNCDTNGTGPSEYGGGTRAQYGTSRGYPPPYICLRDYFEHPTTRANNLNGTRPSGSISAAQIIYNVSQEFNINPQVLIVLLQKEQGLVTDRWPWSLQYRSATGYGCPDTAACNSQYYGFRNQVIWAATMFRAILNGSGSWSNEFRSGSTWFTPYRLGNNRVYWHPDLSRCGSSTVNIQNLTTVALYSYTPYRPNQAALNAGYGTGNSCSSYGNRNFYQYFKDWFGSTTMNYSTDRSISGDWNGDGKTDIGLKFGKRFYIQNTGSSSVTTFTYGHETDVPLVGDWDGNGTDTIGLFRPSTRQYFLNNGFDGSPEHSFTFGARTDKPLVGDWDGNGTDTIGLFRPSTRQYFLNNGFDGSPEVSNSFPW